jgi:monoamine oxidase
VAGGGLAGLTAARELAGQGAEVHVLEARDRLGGRVWTLREPELSPFHAEAGGEFIDGDQTEIRSLVSDLGLRLIPVIRRGFGLALKYGGRVHLSKLQSGYWRSIRRALAPAVASFEAVGADWNGAVAAAIARHSVRDLLAATGADARAVARTEALRGFYLADPDELSALVLLEQLLEGAPGRTSVYRIGGGADRLVERLAQRGGFEIHTRSIVRDVEQNESGVRIAVEGASGLTEHLGAHYLVAAIPSCVMASWTFAPRLPTLQERAFQSLSYGRATKAVLRFSRPWWRRPGRPNAFGTNTAVGAVWDAAEEQRGASMLMLLAGGSASGALQDVIAREGAEGIGRRLSWMGRGAQRPEAMRVVTWEDDPWARGGYAFFSPSFDPALRSWLSRGAGRVLFAGEHTSERWQGYMNGAVESGQRAAREIIALEEIRRVTQQTGRNAGTTAAFRPSS